MSDDLRPCPTHGLTTHRAGRCIACPGAEEESAVSDETTMDLSDGFPVCLLYPDQAALALTSRDETMRQHNTAVLAFSYHLTTTRPERAVLELIGGIHRFVEAWDETDELTREQILLPALLAVEMTLNYPQERLRRDRLSEWVVATAKRTGVDV